MLLSDNIRIARTELLEAVETYVHVVQRDGAGIAVDRERNEVRRFVNRLIEIAQAGEEVVLLRRLLKLDPATGHELWCDGDCKPCAECGGSCVTCSCDSSTVRKESRPVSSEEGMETKGQWGR